MSASITKSSSSFVVQSSPGYVSYGVQVTDDGVESLDVMDHQEPLQGLVTDSPLRSESPDVPH